MMMFIKQNIDLDLQRFKTQHQEIMFSSRNTLIQNKGVGKVEHKILRLVIFLSLSQLVLNTRADNSVLLSNETSNFLVLKNNKIAFLKVDNLIDKTKYRVNERVWITNTQEVFKIEVLEESITNPLYFSKLSQYLPLLSVNLQTKSYLKPLTFSFLSREENSKTPLVRGYKYFKPSYTTGEDNMLQEIGQFLKVLIRQNKLGYLSLRLQDSFNIEVVLPIHTDISNSFGIVTSFSIDYLFSTVQQKNIPSQILSTLTVKTLQQYLSSLTHQTLERKLSGKGLHMMINLTLTLDDKTDIEIQSVKDSCWLEFTDVLPETTYVDSDQRRQEITNYETINVQKPAFDSKQYFYSYKVLLNQFEQVGVNKYLYQQPIHFRYPLPSQLNYTKVYLHPIQQAMIICFPDNYYSQNKQTGLQTDSQRYRIFQVKESALFDRGTAKIPNGDISKAKIVSIVTVAVCLVAVMMIISRLKKF